MDKQSQPVDAEINAQMASYEEKIQRMQHLSIRLINDPTNESLQELGGAIWRLWKANTEMNRAIEAGLPNNASSAKVNTDEEKLQSKKR
ncbi:Oidioi.mRNA.OKI2018_I69.XSR.g16374.t1.cds [Oikopleura dioica]|uniref:Oidioi.mRNA.OKI2018_I69.XSR.g16374.t1.cds n=1 Tax=Oikopleura dioica TaxID=34765 RepID=A0ABN7SKR5_OIKDI|nr:Oidioi.mRNA.OKI2018_I69.XSR.g16374.t1.cds [Oikopleura dioica]